MGSDGATTTTTNQNYDKPSSRKMARIAQRQQRMAEDQYRLYKRYGKPYDIEALQANRDLLPYITASSQATLEEQMRDLAANQPVKDALRQEQLEEIERSRPVADKFYQDALNGVDPQDRMNRAQADVAQGFDQSAATTRRDASRMGINLNSGRMAAALSDTGLERAKAIGAARTGARQMAETENFSRLGTAMGVRGMASGLPGVQSMQGQGQTNFGVDPYGRASSGMQAAAGSYAPLATRVNSSESIQTGGGGWQSMLGSMVGTGIGAYAGNKFG